MKMYSIYDRTAEEYLPPFCAKNDEVAKRIVSNPGAPYDGYCLYLVGKFSSDTGRLEACDPLYIYDVPVKKEMNTNAV